MYATGKKRKFPVGLELIFFTQYITLNYTVSVIGSHIININIVPQNEHHQIELKLKYKTHHCSRTR